MTHVGLHLFVSLVIVALTSFFCIGVFTSFPNLVVRFLDLIFLMIWISSILLHRTIRTSCTFVRFFIKEVLNSTKKRFIAMPPFLGGSIFIRPYKWFPNERTRPPTIREICKFVNNVYYHFVRWTNDQNKSCRSWWVLHLLFSWLFQLKSFTVSKCYLK